MRAPSQSVPPKIRARAPSPGLFAGVVLAAAVLGAGAVLFSFNPASGGFYPVCLFHRLTGLNCPGCGGTRSLHALLHGNVSLALKDNALFLFLLPAIALRGAWLAWKKHSGRPAGPFFPVKFLWGLLAATVIFTVLRNLPAFAFLSP